MSDLGPYFNCYPSDWQDGIANLDDAQTNFYFRLVLKMYDTADAIRMTDRDIARLANSNVRKWNRVKAELIDLNKLKVLSDGSIMNKRALRQMSEYIISRKGFRNQPDPHVIKRFAKLLEMFGESLAKVSRNFAETYPKILNENNDHRKQPAPAPAPAPTPQLTTATTRDEVISKDLRACLEAAAAALDQDTEYGSEELMMWSSLDPPCSLDLDVIPVLKKLGKREAGKNIRSLRYFTPAIIDARDHRIRTEQKSERGQDEPDHNQRPRRSNTQQAIATTRRGATASVLDRRKARRKATETDIS